MIAKEERDRRPGCVILQAPTMDLLALGVENQHLQILNCHEGLHAVVVSVAVDLQTFFLPMILQVIGGTAKDDKLSDLLVKVV